MHFFLHDKQLETNNSLRTHTISYLIFILFEKVHKKFQNYKEMHLYEKSRIF